MFRDMKSSIFLLLLVFFVANLSGCGRNMSLTLRDNSLTPTRQSTRTTQDPVKADPVKLSFLMTNDIHGHVENLAVLGGITQQLRARDEYQSQTAALFVIDSGDQFQGTLASNHDEGTTVFNALNEIGYDAIIPGNHDYDFGPIGWLFDKVTSGQTSDDPREVIKKVAAIAKFPMLSANTYLKTSLRIRSSGATLALDAECKASDQTLAEEINFEDANRPDFLKPYAILEKAGVRVALIGLDNHATTSVTTSDNVSDLCFRDEFSTYLEVRKSLEGQADVFVILLHGGNAGPGQYDASDLAKKINFAYPNGVQLVAAGHTHYTHNVISGGVHVVQDGANAKTYGRVDLYYDSATHAVISDRTDSAAGIEIIASKCDAVKIPFVCNQLVLPIAPNAAINQIAADADAAIAPLAKRKLGTATGTIFVDRVNESPLGNILTDALRKATGTEIAIMNNGGIRTSLKSGDVLYENLFEVSPFQNQAVVIKHFEWTKLKGVLLAAARTCGKYGSLSQSGLKVQYLRSCNGSTTIAPDASLAHVETVSGEVLLDAATQFEVDGTKSLSLTTLDFLASGSGDGYRDFAGVTIDEKPGIARELIVTVFQADQPIMNASIDDRFVNVASPASSTTSSTDTPSPPPSPTPARGAGATAPTSTAK